MIEPNRIYQGDALTVLKSWPDAFVQCVVTSPPYFGLRDYGVEGQLGLEPTPGTYIAKLVEVFREIRRVLKKDGVMFLNLGDTYAINPKRGDRSNYLGLHTNIVESGCHKATQHRDITGYKEKDLIGIPWRVAFALQADGWYLRQDIIWSKPNPMPESVKDRCTKAHEYIFLLAKSERYYYDADAIKEPSKSPPIIPWEERKAAGEPMRHGMSHMAPALNGMNKKRRSNDNLTNGKWSDQDKQSSGKRIVENVARARANGANHDNPFGGWRNKRSVWEITTKPFHEAHFATYPEKLVEPCILAGSREGDIVLDPFMGSGTTAVVAKRFKRNWLGIEINLAYQAIAEKRIAGEPIALLTET